MLSVPVDGVWSSWGVYQACGRTNYTGDGGYCVCARFCNNPKARYGGRRCEGENLKTLPCGNCDCGSRNRGKREILTRLY